MKCDAVRVAAVQMVSGPEVAANLATAGRLIAEAAAGGAELVALPEYFPLISPDEQAKVRAREQPGHGPIQDFLAETAARHGIWLVGGTLPLLADAPDKVRNACLVYGPDGRLLSRYDKIHLFGFCRGSERYDESVSIEAGSAPVAFDTPFGRVALGVCYDLRFPELFRSLGEVDLLILPAAFTWTTGQAHWEVLLRARAIENLCYVLAPAQGGVHPGGRRTFGHSLAIDPWGEVLACRDSGEGVVLATLRAERLDSLRESLPALRHRRILEAGTAPLPHPSE